MEWQKMNIEDWPDTARASSPVTRLCSMAQDWIWPQRFLNQGHEEEKEEEEEEEEKEEEIVLRVKWAYVNLSQLSE